MIDLLLMIGLGFLGSFGHCAGMCGPLTIAFAMADRQSLPQRIQFQGLLNTGRLLSYGLVGGAMGGVGSVVVASGQMAGIGSGLRQTMAIVTGLLLIWSGLIQLLRGQVGLLPLLNPMAIAKLHEGLSRVMMKLSFGQRWWSPLLLGLCWGLMPCGFLYTAQIKATEQSSPILGAALMLAFGLGTLPVMLGVGVSVSSLGADRQSQLFRLGGWLTLTIGLLTLGRSGNTHSDWTGHGALLLLMLALLAGPLARLKLANLLPLRRLLGLSAFILALVHSLHMAAHSFGWQWAAIAFLSPMAQVGLAFGLAALVGLIPGALTSFDRAQVRLGGAWRQLHQWTAVPALILAVGHSLLLGSHYWAQIPLGWRNYGAIGGLSLGLILLLGLRWVGRPRSV
jgi:uncharacterized protein